MSFKVNKNLSSDLWEKIFVKKINPKRSSTVIKNIEKLNKNPIVIGGCGRSGTTLLASILGSNEEVYTIDSETALLCPGCYGENQIPIALNTIKKNLEIDKNKFFNICFDKKLTAEKRWCEKTPRNIYYFEKIKDLFDGKVELVEIIRDGRDVILSKHSSNNENFWVSIERWVYEVSIGRKIQSSTKHHVIKYEDLVSNCEKYIEKLSKNIGIQAPYDWENWTTKTNLKNNFAFGGNVKPIFNSSVRKWEKDSTGRVNEFMKNKEAVNLLNQLGYL